MAAGKSTSSKSPLVLICGDDEHGVKRRAREIFEHWRSTSPEGEVEVIDAQASLVSEAMQCLGRLREALQTLPFFGGDKIIWFRNCNFLGEERTAGGSEVTTFLNDLAAEWKTFDWKGVRLLISTGKVDKRKTFFRSIKAMAPVEEYEAWSTSDRDWEAKAEAWIHRELKPRGKVIASEAAAILVAGIGPNPRFLEQELEKVCLYVGERDRIGTADVEAICTRNKQARAFALGEALGDRDLLRLFKTLDEEMWGMRHDRQRTEIGLLYGLITKLRTLLFLREMVDCRLVRLERDYRRFQAQWGRLPADRFPEEKRFNPAAMKPYIFFKAQSQIRNYTSAELVRGMELLLKCNLALVSSGLDSTLVLQRTLVQIVEGRQGR